MLEVDFRMFPLFFLFFQDKLTSELAVPSTSLIDMHRADQLILATFVDYCAIGTSKTIDVLAIDSLHICGKSLWV